MPSNSSPDPRTSASTRPSAIQTSTPRHSTSFHQPYTESISELHTSYAGCISALEAENTALRQDLVEAQQKPAELRGQVIALQNTLAARNNVLGFQERKIQRLELKVEGLMGELQEEKLKRLEVEAEAERNRRSKGPSLERRAAKRRRSRSRRSQNSTPVKTEDVGEKSDGDAEGVDETMAVKWNKAKKVKIEDASPPRIKSENAHTPKIKSERRIKRVLEEGREKGTGTSQDPVCL